MKRTIAPTPASKRAPTAGGSVPGLDAARALPYAIALAAAWLGAEALATTGIVPSPLMLAGSLLQIGFFCAALAGAFVLHAASRRPIAERLAAVTLGAIASVVGRLASPTLPWWNVLGCGLGLSSLLVLGVHAIRARGSGRAAALDVLLPGLLLPGFVFVSSSWLALTSALHPLTWDHYAFRADAAFGAQPSFVVGLLFRAAPPLAGVALAVYIALPLAFAAIQAADLRIGRHATPGATLAFLAVAGLGYLLYLLFPVAGPVYVFGGYPAHAPTPATVSLAAVLAQPVPRNCMPSLHTAWALMAFWLARPHARWLRALAGAFLGFTLLATLGLGFHYLVDLVAAFPFTALVYAALTRVAPAAERLRRATIAGGAAVLAGWLAFVRLAPDLLAGVPGAMWLLSATVVATSWAAVSALQRRAAPTPHRAPAVRPAPAASAPRASMAVGTAFFLSGFAALCYEVVFAKAFAVTYGSTARAAATVLAVYMGGLALGSWWGGRFAMRSRRPLAAFALVEAGVGVWCALFPVALAGVRSAYFGIARGADPASPWLIPLQVALQAAAMLPATMLMGCSLPLLARHLTDRAEGIGRAVGRLYAVNTAGAASGALLAGYLLLPALGITRTVLFAVGLDLLVAVIARELSRRTESEIPIVASIPEVHAGTDGAGQTGASERLRRLGWVPLVVTSIGGILTFALETTYVHLLAVVAGNSAYAFALMVFAFLVGLSAGSAAGRRLLRSGLGMPAALAASQLALTVVLLAGVRLWDAMPSYFASFEHYPIVRGFGAREVVRFAVCSLAMVPPALFIGAAYPVVMAWVGAANPGREVAAIGRAGAINTAGNILGAILGGFVMIPLLGSLHSVQALAALAFALGLLTLSVARAKPPAWVAALAMVAALTVTQPKTLDYTRLSSGANVYFASQAYGRVLDHAESQDGGLTAIAESKDLDGARVLTMLTNGKFQGDDSDRREMASQVSFSLFPLLHTEERGPALVIGLGTGVSARVASDAGFKPVHVAELSRDVAQLATRYFGKVNGGVLARPDTVLHVADGRNLLALDERSYSFIGLEVTSIWFAGASSLYNREFYALARSRLTDHGVLQQWIQLHHLSRSDLLSILASARAEFPHIWLYFAPNQGVLVACAWDCDPTEATVRRVATEPQLAADVRRVGGAAALMRQRLLGPDDVDRLLASAREQDLDPVQLVSTDDNLLLEYSTPRGNVRPYAESLRDNLAFVHRFAPASPLAGTRLTAAQWDAIRSREPRAATP